MSRSLGKVALSTVAAATVLTLAAPAQAAPAETVAVTVASANGSGCPVATTDPATATVDPDGSSFTVGFSGYAAFAGDGAPATAFRRTCGFSFEVTRPAGLTYAVSGASYSGFALLQDGVTGLRQTRYYFQGEAETLVGRQAFAGPSSEGWQDTDAFGAASRVFAPCDAERNLNILTELRVSRPDPAAPTSVMVLNPSFSVDLTWRPCS